MDAKALQDDLESLGFTPSLAKPEIGKEVGRRRAGELKGFPIFCIGIIEDVFEMEGKNCEDQERLKT